MAKKATKALPRRAACLLPVEIFLSFQPSAKFLTTPHAAMARHSYLSLSRDSLTPCCHIDCKPIASAPLLNRGCVILAISLLFDSLTLMHKGPAHGAFPGRGLPVTKHENNYHDADLYTKPDSRAASWKDGRALSRHGSLCCAVETICIAFAEKLRQQLKN